MIGSLEISGYECVCALVLTGFRVLRRARGSTLLERDRHLVIVPDALVLAPSVLERILSSANVSHDAFVNLLSEEPTLPDLTLLHAT
jgi:hypothetical protein